jgi:hypothetical protein
VHARGEHGRLRLLMRGAHDVLREDVRLDFLAEKEDAARLLEGATSQELVRRLAATTTDRDDWLRYAVRCEVERRKQQAQRTLPAIAANHHTTINHGDTRRAVLHPTQAAAVDHALRLLHGAQLVRPAHSGAVRGRDRRGRKGRHGGCALLGMADGLPRRLVRRGRLMM